MKYVCPISGRRLSREIDVVNHRGEVVRQLFAGDGVVDAIRAGRYLPTGSRRRITTLIERADDGAPSTFRRPAKTAARENLNGWRVWSHTRAARQWIEP